MMFKKTSLLLLLLLAATSVSAVSEINIVGLFKDRAIVELDGVRRMLVKGKISPEGVLLVSADSKEAVLEINGKKNTYKLGTRISNMSVEPTGQIIETVAPDNTGMYFVNGSINGFIVTFMVDTGATLISMNRHQAKRFGIDYKMEGEQAVSNTASGRDKVYLVNLKQVKVGNIELNNVQGAVHDGDFPQVILLGNSFLGRVDLKREGKLLKLKKMY